MKVNTFLALVTTLILTLGGAYYITGDDLSPGWCVAYAEGDYVDSTMMIGSTSWTWSEIDSVHAFKVVAADPFDTYPRSSASSKGYQWSTSGAGFEVLGALVSSGQAHTFDCLTSPLQTGSAITLEQANQLLKRTAWNLRSP